MHQNAKCAFLTGANAPQRRIYHHETMAEHTIKTAAPARNIRASGGQISSNDNSSTAQMTPDLAIGAAAQVFDTPELLELILSNLELKDLLLRAPLACRGFKASIDSSPSINKRLENIMVDHMRDFHETRRAFCNRYRYMWLSSGVSGQEVRLGFLFDEAHIERFISSPSFRKLRMPNTYGGCVYESKCQGGIDKTRIFGLLTSEDEDTVTIAELLEEVVSDGPVGTVILKLIFNGLKLD